MQPSETPKDPFNLENEFTEDELGQYAEKLAKALALEKRKAQEKLAHTEADAAKKDSKP